MGPPSGRLAMGSGSARVETGKFNAMHDISLGIGSRAPVALLDLGHLRFAMSCVRALPVDIVLQAGQGRARLQVPWAERAQR